MAATTDTSTSTEVDVLVKTAIAKVQAGQVTLSELMSALNPPQTSPSTEVAVPLPKAITPAQRAAVDRLPEVFGKVVPSTPRALAPTEVVALAIEKQTLDEIKSMAVGRLSDITLTVHNHLDAAYAQATPEDKRKFRDDKGHYVVAGRAPAPDLGVAFSREVRNGSAGISVEALAALDTGEPDALLSHEDFLAMTRQVRVLDENRVMEAVNRKPELVRALAAATVPGSASTSVFLRKM